VAVGALVRVYPGLQFLHVIDLHCHVLPGIDDGPKTIEGSLALARAAATAGTRVIVATPHVSWRYPNESATIAALTDELNERLSAEGIALEVRAGAEIAMTRAGEIQEQELGRLTIGGGPWVLLEPPFSPVITGLEGVVAELRSAGHRILLAHPERCPAFHREPRTLEALLRGGALSSITAGSLTGQFGGQVRRFARRLMTEGMVHNVASDAHDSLKRPPGTGAQLAQAGFGQLSEWLTQAVPEAILSGEEIPRRPIEATAGTSRFRGPRWRRRG
jgi:protein-tyrosine phosphatase